MADKESATCSPEQADLIFDLIAEGALVTGLGELQAPI